LILGYCASSAATTSIRCSVGLLNDLALVVWGGDAFTVPAPTARLFVLAGWWCSSRCRCCYTARASAR